MCELVVVSKAGPDVLAESIEQGLLLSKANLTFRCVCARCLLARVRVLFCVYFSAVSCLNGNVGFAIARLAKHAILRSCASLLGRSSSLIVPFGAQLLCRRDGELVRGRAAMMPVITSKDWQVRVRWRGGGCVCLCVGFVRLADG